MNWRLDPIALFDGDFGPFLVPVSPPDAAVLGLDPKDRGKAPAILTHNGWTLAKNWLALSCPDYQTAVLWRDGWRANVGIKGGIVLGVDNDIGEDASEILRLALLKEGVNPLRRIVLDPKHKRDCFVLRLVDFIDDPVIAASRDLTFHKGILKGQIQLLSQGKQFVVHGTHPGTRTPYGWDREIHRVADIPAISVEGLDRALRALVDGLQAIGWALTAGTVSRAPGGFSVVPFPCTPAQRAEADALLAILPNRDLPHDQKTPLDFYFDDYGPYILLAYVIFAVFGEEGEGRWLAWAYGRPQIKSKPETVWASVRNNPDVRVGLHTLQNLAQEFAPEALAGFRFSTVPIDPEIEGEEDEDPPPVSEPYWDTIRLKWGFVYEQGQCVNMNTGGLVRRDAFNDLLRLKAGQVEGELFPMRRGKPLTMSTIMSLRSDTPIFRNLTYAPGEPQKVPVEDAPGEFDFNRWFPTPHGVTPNVTPDRIKPWFDHVDYMLGPDKDLFIEWCAWVVQNPILKPNWHFLIITIQGTGKDMMVLPLELAVGKKNFISSLIFQIADNFNDVLEHKLIVVSETRHVNTRNFSTHDTSTKLQAILAEPPRHHTINKKNEKRYQIPNRQALILFSNENNPLYLEPQQRRIRVANRLDIPTKDALYYQALSNWLDHGGSELVASYLRQLKLGTDVDLRMKGRAPDAGDTVELEQTNRNPVHVAIDDWIAEARNGNGSSLVVQAADIANGVASLFPRRPPSSREVGEYLRQLEKNGKDVSRARRELDDKGHDLGRAGIVSNGKNSGRLWLLDMKLLPLGPPQWIALWLGNSAPPSATVTPIRKRQLAEQPPSPPPNPPEDDDEAM